MNLQINQLTQPLVAMMALSMGMGAIKPVMAQKEGLFDLQKGEFNIGLIMGPMMAIIMMMVFLTPSEVCQCTCADCGNVWQSSKYFWGWSPSSTTCPVCGSANVSCVCPLG